MAAVEAHGVRQVYGRGLKDRVVALDGVDLTVQKGESLGIVGESGSGKSTLARILTGIEQPHEGTVLVNGRPLPTAGRAWRERRRQLQLIPQHAGGALDARVTMEQHLAEVVDAHHLAPDRAARRRLIADSLERVGLAAEHGRKRPRQLSGGQQQRVIIARSLLLSPEILFADEPTSALDLLVRRQIVDLLNVTCRGPHRVFAIVTHDLQIVDGLCDRLIVMKNGKIVESGPTETLLSNPQHAYTRQLVTAAFQTTPSALAAVREAG
ncbi:ABC transporter ATP-binding protein [Amycolatopsis sp. CA-161197]|uniref:ABC transporter ATP-binding protein n=1 Tax=Amycolatopsis sp. CA-161197 TaxID=3239922 RepID=UPI003D8D1B3A